MTEKKEQGKFTKENEGEARKKYNFSALYPTYSEGYTSRNGGSYTSLAEWIEGEPYSQLYDDENHINNIISSGSATEKSNLSRYFFSLGGFYWRIVSHYATFLQYTGLLIPHAKKNAKINSRATAKRYNNALDFIENSQLKNTLTRIAYKVIVDGSYYGLIPDGEEEDRLKLIDLPFKYARSRLRDLNGTLLVEMDVSYFDTVDVGKIRNSTLQSYPKFIRDHYLAYSQQRGGIDPWILIPVERGVCFRFHDDRPMLLHVIPDSIKYDAAVSRNATREIEEIKKIIVQKVPHIASTGELVFEPDEAEEMHHGVVDMLGPENPNTSLITTYADTSAIVSKVNADPASTNNLEKMKNNLYSTAGTSMQLFAPTANQGIVVSLQNDLALVMVLANSMSEFLTRTLNTIFSTTTIDFTYNVLPISWYNATEYLNNAQKMASFGYSFLVPALAIGITQKDLLDLKALENDLLHLDEILVPLQSAYTQSNKDRSNPRETSKQSDNPEGGRPPIEDIKRTDKTKQNQDSAGDEV